MSLNLISNFIAKQSIGQSGGSSHGGNFLTITLLSLILLFVKVFLVYWSYNEVVPKLSKGMYRKITMMEALFLVILVQSLFN